MDLRNKKSAKIIRITFLIIIVIMVIELIFAGILFIIKKKNQNKINSADTIIENTSLKLITEIEKETMLQKNAEELKIPEKPAEIDTNPRTRPLPQIKLK